MKNQYRRQASSIVNNLAKLIALSLLISSAAAQQYTPKNHCQLNIKPYYAKYSGSSNGVKGTLRRQLKQQQNGQWQLTNTAKVLFLNFTEKSQFNLNNSSVVPSSYEFSNPIKSSKNSDLSFDWVNKKAIDKDRGNSVFALQSDTLDRLSVLTQARLHLMENCGYFTKQNYKVIDDNKFKAYIVEPFGEETIETPLGSLKTTVLKQYRVNNTKKHTLLWFAKDKEFLLVKISVVKNGEKETMIIKESSF